MIERFYTNSKILYPYIEDIINRYNVNILKFNIDNKNDVDMLFDLLRCAVTSNCSELDFLYQLYGDIEDLKKQKSGDEYYIFTDYKIKWRIAFKEMDKKYSACEMILGINNLKKKE